MQKGTSGANFIKNGQKLPILEFWSHLGDFTPLCPPKKMRFSQIRPQNSFSNAKSYLWCEFHQKRPKIANFGIWSHLGGFYPTVPPPKKCDFPKSDRKTHFQIQKGTSGENFIKNGRKLTDISLNNPLELNLPVPFGIKNTICYDKISIK